MIAIECGRTETPRQITKKNATKPSNFITKNRPPSAAPPSSPSAALANTPTLLRASSVFFFAAAVGTDRQKEALF